MYMRNYMMVGLGLFLLAGCGGGDGQPQSEAANAPPATVSGLTPFQEEHGIGPITEVLTLGEVDPALAATGAEIFQGKCSACHKMDVRYVGPALGEVTTRRSPAFIMNMILNPQEMYERHPVVKELLAQYMSFMANQGLTVDEARAVLEYLRTQTSS